MRVSESGTWVRPFGPSGEVTCRLFCLPHAGGGISAFNRWSQFLPPNIQVCAAQLPGRDSRFGEQAYKRLELLLESFQAALIDQGWLERPFALFGHSVGALIAFELCRSLRHLGGPAPEILFLSGRRAAHLPLRVPELHTLPHRELLYTLEKLGGLPVEALKEEALMELFLPVLRADLAVDETYVYGPDTPLSCPLSVFGGTEDHFVLPAELDAWKYETTGSFTLRLIEGGHFFVQSSRASLLAAIEEDLIACGLFRR